MIVEREPCCSSFCSTCLAFYITIDLHGYLHNYLVIKDTCKEYSSSVSSITYCKYHSAKLPESHSNSLCVCSCGCRRAADYILPLLDSQRFKGVCFFSPDSKQWMILEARGRCLPKRCSPVAERECFAVFDDARCRGADLKV